MLDSHQKQNSPFLRLVQDLFINGGENLEVVGSSHLFQWQDYASYSSGRSLSILPSHGLWS